MSKRVSRFLGELEQLGQAFSQAQARRPARSNAARVDLIEIKPGVWVEPRATDTPEERSVALEHLGDALGLEPDEMQLLGRLWNA